MVQGVEVGRRGLVVDGVEELLFSAEVHPWRLDPESWGDVLDAIVGLGFRTVSTYVSWARHERGPGQFDFSGALDIVAFLELAADRGLRAVVRVGPNTAAEQEDSGWPERILADERCQARRPNGLPYVLLSSTGHCFPPSYASRVVLDEIGGWYDALIPRLAPLQHPDGPIVLCQVDNELGYHFQANTYALDYHPETIEQFRAWVGDASAVPPVDACDGPEPRQLAWVEWKEEHLRHTLRTLAAMVRSRGMDRVPLFHNDYPRLSTPLDLGALEGSGAVDVAAADIYATKEGGRYVRDLCRHLAGSSRLPFLAELGAGWLSLPWLLPLDLAPADEEAVAVRALFSGIRAANVYMLVERDRWYGSPVRADGTVREKAALYPRLFRLMDDIGWWHLERVAPALLVENRTEARRIAARDTLGSVAPSFTQLLPLDARLTSVPNADSDELARWERGFGTALDGAGVDFDRASSSALPDLTRYETVLLPTLDALEPAVWDALVAAAALGVRVGVGPRVPKVDGRLSPRGFEVADGIVVLGDPSEAVSLVGVPQVRCPDARVDVHHLRRPGEDRSAVVMAANASGDAVATTIVCAVAGVVTFEGRWRDERLVGEDGCVRVELEPWAVQVWEVHQ